MFIVYSLQSPGLLTMQLLMAFLILYKGETSIISSICVRVCVYMKRYVLCVQICVILCCFDVHYHKPVYVI